MAILALVALLAIFGALILLLLLSVRRSRRRTFGILEEVRRQHPQDYAAYEELRDRKRTARERTHRGRVIQRIDDRFKRRQEEWRSGRKERLGRTDDARSILDLAAGVWPFSRISSRVAYALILVDAALFFVGFALLGDRAPVATVALAVIGVVLFVVLRRRAFQAEVDLYHHGLRRAAQRWTKKNEQPQSPE